MSANHVTDQTFESEVLQNDGPVLVDFWAPWCGPCRAMSSVVEQVADEVASHASVVKVNVDDSKQAALQYGVQSIPTFAVFRDGKVQSQFSGIVPREKLLEALAVETN